MADKVLVAYATKYGATAGIAERIGQTLQQAGLAAEVRLAAGVRDLSPYDAVVLGSAVYTGQWRKEAVDLLTGHERALTDRPVWLFSSGPTGEGDPNELLNGWHFPESLEETAARIKPRDIAFFSGEIDPGKLTFVEKMLVKGINAPTGDYRDWEAIESWANSIADALKQDA